MSVNWTILVPYRKGEYLGKIFAKYRHEVQLATEDLDYKKLQEIEEWCKENFGKLNKNSAKSSWNIAYEYKFIEVAQQNKHFQLQQYTIVICFLFHDLEKATAFKLRWL